MFRCVKSVNESVRHRFDFRKFDFALWPNLRYAPFGHFDDWHAKSVVAIIVTLLQRT